MVMVSMSGLDLSFMQDKPKKAERPQDDPYGLTTALRDSEKAEKDKTKRKKK